MSYHTEVAKIVSNGKKKLELKIQELTPIGKLMYLKSELLTLVNTDISGLSFTDRISLISNIRACRMLIDELGQNGK